MRLRLLLPSCQVAALAAGCHFGSPGSTPGDGKPPSDGAPDDGPLVDAPVDAPTDAPPAGACLQRWRDGTVALGTPVRLSELGSTDADREPFLTTNELTIYFSSSRTANGDVYSATRAAIGAAFGPPQLEAAISSPEADGRFTMTGNRLIGVVASNRTGTEGNTDLWLATRTDASAPFGTFEAADGMPNINSGGEELDPELAFDGLTLYVTREGPRRIARSVRSNVNGSFGSPQDVGGLAAGDADPSLSPDELVIVFSSRRNGSSTDELWYAARTGKTAAFGTPALVPGVNSGGNQEVDPALSADGCRLYFASDRGGNFELFVAAMLP